MQGCDPLEFTSIYQRNLEDSEDSDGEGGLGNVNRLIMRPPGHSGKAKRGHLCFDASFETGNLGRVDLINEYEYDLFIRPDTCSPRFRFWFNFTVDNVKQDQRVIFNIVNISKYRNVFNENLTPVVKSSTRPKWQRIPKTDVFYQRSLTHHGHYVLSFAFAFDREDEVFQFSIAAPYSYSKLQAYLSCLESKATHLNESFSRELLGNSIQKRRLDVITIGSKGIPSVKNKKRVVVVLARVHPGESPSSFVCQGLLEFLVSSHPLATLLREHVIFKIVPMLNPDGVFLGNYRSTLMGFDLNRSYHIASSWAHPTLRATIDMIIALDKGRDLQLDFVLDIHAHTTLKGCFIYGNTYEDVYRYERHIVFPKLLANTADDYAHSNAMFNSDVNKIGTARRFFCSTLSNKVNCYTFQVSIYGYHAHGSELCIPYNEESYMRCGRNLGKAFLEYYQIIGAIPVSLTSDVGEKKRRPKTHRSKLTARSWHSDRPKTTRSRFMLHFTDVNYDSETSGEELHHSYRYQLSPTRTPHQDRDDHYLKKLGGGGRIKCSRVGSPPPTTYIVMPEPSLSIIDFNLITRNEIDAAAKRKN
ncbi:hypothetical protein PPYR_05619 [Photinus pyralis]|uniref:Peptidase M14 domain-containing protein n=2 Tax=Photinus pyralis TaxID=7054 RepID=A0A1Y1KS82_PHOPY|nr:cytosolic carboxypeptidase 6 isoform X1 [Photinus pyralis]KAB0801265.1 hypothetical protein PPYR_05619 [Photinus pyralis]